MCAGTESCIRLVDVDEDGRDDVIFGMAKVKFANAGENSLDELKKTCSDGGKCILILKDTYIFKIKECTESITSSLLLYLIFILYLIITLNNNYQMLFYCYLYSQSNLSCRLHRNNHL